MYNKTTLTSINEDTRIALMVSIRKALHKPIDLLRLLRQVDLHEKLANRHIQRIAEESEFTHEAAHDCDEELIVLFRQDTGNLAAINAFLDPCQVFPCRLSFLPVRQGHPESFSAEGERVVL